MPNEAAIPLRNPKGLYDSLGAASIDSETERRVQTYRNYTEIVDAAEGLKTVWLKVGPYTVCVTPEPLSFREAELMQAVLCNMVARIAFDDERGKQVRIQEDFKSDEAAKRAFLEARLRDIHELAPKLIENKASRRIKELAAKRLPYGDLPSTKRQDTPAV